MPGCPVPRRPRRSCGTGTSSAIIVRQPLDRGPARRPDGGQPAPADPSAAGHGPRRALRPRRPRRRVRRGRPLDLHVHRCSAPDARWSGLAGQRGGGPMSAAPIRVEEREDHLRVTLDRPEVQERHQPRARRGPARRLRPAGAASRRSWCCPVARGSSLRVRTSPSSASATGWTPCAGSTARSSTGSPGCRCRRSRSSTGRPSAEAPSWPTPATSGSGRTRAKFGNPEVGLGIIAAAGACWRLVELVGEPLAKEILLAGRVLEADEALAAHLLTQVVSEEELDAAVECFRPTRRPRRAARTAADQDRDAQPARLPPRDRQRRAGGPLRDRGEAASG